MGSFSSVFCDHDIWSNVDFYRKNPICSKESSHRTFLFDVCSNLGMVLLDTAATSHMDIMKRKMLCMTGVCLVIIYFSWLLSFFRFKKS